MHIGVLDLLAAAGGGFLGATLGGLIAFVFTGVAVIAGIVALIGSGEPEFLNSIAFGGFFGPHISFAGGVGAAAYAYRRGYLSNGRDIVTPLVSLAKPTVLVVGAIFGVLGHVIQQLIAIIPGFGTTTDSVALAVVVSALGARLAFGRSGVIGKHADGLTGRKKFSPDAQHSWLAYQQEPVMAVVLGLFVGGLSAWASVTLLAAYPQAPSVIFIGFGISAVSLLFLTFGIQVPATHHITLVSAVAVGAFAGQLNGAQVALVLIGAAAGAVTALLGEMFSRFWLIRGDTHIDPPASAIWPMTTIVLVIAAVAT